MPPKQYYDHTTKKWLSKKAVASLVAKYYDTLRHNGFEDIERTAGGKFMSNRFLMGNRTVNLEEFLQTDEAAEIDLSNLHEWMDGSKVHRHESLVESARVLLHNPECSDKLWLLHTAHAVGGLSEHSLMEVTDRSRNWVRSRLVQIKDLFK